MQDGPEHGTGFLFVSANDRGGRRILSPACFATVGPTCEGWNKSGTTLLIPKNGYQNTAALRWGRFSRIETASIETRGARGNPDMVI